MMGKLFGSASLSFASFEVTPQIHLSSFAQPSVFYSLVSHGSVAKGIFNTYWHDLQQMEIEDGQVVPLELQR